MVEHLVIEDRKQFQLATCRSRKDVGSYESEFDILLNMLYDHRGALPVKFRSIAGEDPVVVG